jgi:hypothetical protein
MMCLNPSASFDVLLCLFQLYQAIKFICLWLFLEICLRKPWPFFGESSLRETELVLALVVFYSTSAISSNELDGVMSYFA